MNKNYNAFGHLPALRPFVVSLFCSFLIAISAGVQAQPDHAYQQILDRGVEAGIEAGQLDILLERAQNRGLDPSDLARLTEPPIQLAERNLPYQAVIQKSMEGLAKRVPTHSIQQVLEDMSRGMIRSADLVDPWLERSEVHALVERGRGNREMSNAMDDFRRQLIENTSYALQHEQNGEYLREFLDEMIAARTTERSGMGSIASAIRTLPDLPAPQDQPETRSRLLIRALNAGFSPGQIQQLPDAFHSAQFRSQLPVENIARGMEQQMQRGIPADHILDNIFKGNVGGGPPGFTPPGLEGRGEGGRGRGRRPDVPPGNGGPPDDM
ncbi:hypothetical protein QA596_08775 [Balneolales bacterium ANBcel1]|nr:hypothetical protein [Balneolales bacterium ANBcel1]